MTRPKRLTEIASDSRKQTLYSLDGPLHLTEYGYFQLLFSQQGAAANSPPPNTNHDYVIMRAGRYSHPLEAPSSKKQRKDYKKGFSCRQYTSYKGVNLTVDEINK